MQIQPGDVIGSYQIYSEIGRGGRTVVYQVSQRTTGRWVALKVLRKQDPRALEEFRREAEFTANLGHGSVRQVYDAGQTPDGYPFLAMQFVDTSLRQLLRARQEQGRTFSQQEVARTLGPVADVLDHVHGMGIVHLDIKPENIFIFRDGQVVLGDFGSARQIGGATHEGTPRYLSPEQAAGDRLVSAQSDVYSLAVVAYEMLTGQLPFGGELDIVLVRQHLEAPPRPLRQANPHLPRELEKVIGNALSKDPRQRPASARAFVERVRTARSRAVSGRRKGLGRGLLIPAIVVPLVLFLGIALIALPILKTTPTPTNTPTATSLPTSTTRPTLTPSPAPTQTLAPTATPRPTSTPKPPPPTQPPTSASSARGRYAAIEHPATATLHRFTSAFPANETAPRSPAQGDTYVQ